MNKRIRSISFLLIGLTLINSSCLEIFEAGTEMFEDILVVQATITDEIKYQEIMLSRSFKFEDENPIKESNALVRVVDSNGNSIAFNQGEPGTYISEIPFGATSNLDYRLTIETQNGEKIISEAVSLPEKSKINQLIPERRFNSNGLNGMAILVNSFDPSGNSRYYRYEYEETYKIIAPFWNPFDLFVSSNDPTALELRGREREERICFNSEKNTDIILESTINRDEDRIKDFPVRFISSGNYIISHRYSILVKQYVLSFGAFNFYQTLKDLSQSENLFSSNQPGFVAGNLNSESGDRVAGYFDVASVDTKRVYFNYDDFYEGEKLPPYATSCIKFAPLDTGNPGESSLFLQVADGNVRFFAFNDDASSEEGPYFLVSRICGDCTALGTNIKPDFWEDE